MAFLGYDWPETRRGWNRLKVAFIEAWPQWKIPAWRRANLVWCPLLMLGTLAVLVITQPPAHNVAAQLGGVILIWCLGYFAGTLVQKALDDHDHTSA